MISLFDDEFDKCSFFLFKCHYCSYVITLAENVEEFWRSAVYEFLHNNTILCCYYYFDGVLFFVGLHVHSAAAAVVYVCQTDDVRRHPKQ